MRSATAPCLEKGTREVRGVLQATATHPDKIVRQCFNPSELSSKKVMEGKDRTVLGLLTKFGFNHGNGDYAAEVNRYNSNFRKFKNLYTARNFVLWLVWTPGYYRN